MSGTERYRIEPDGTVVTVYTDTVDLRVVGHVHTVRASVVEWDESGQVWTARILATSERLGPFTTRTEAVAAERAVLATRLGNAARGTRNLTAMSPHQIALTDAPAEARRHAGPEHPRPLNDGASNRRGDKRP